jgi:hypothetical protein
MNDEFSKANEGGKNKKRPIHFHQPEKNRRLAKFP